MPRRPRFRTAEVSALHEGLRFAPPETRRRQMAAAERLIDELGPLQLYPEEFLLFRITGFRPEVSGAEGASLVGEALVADLVTFVERISETLELDHHEREGGAAEWEEAATLLGVTPRSLQRYRSRGLLVHWIRFPDGSRRVGCFRESLRRFQARQRDQGHAPRPHRRVSAAERAALLAEAQQLAASRNTTLHAAAQTLAAAHGRPLESVRDLLRGERSLRFSEPRRFGAREVRLAWRAWRRGVDVASIASHLGRAEVAVWRAVNRGRREVLLRLRFHAAALPTFERPEAAEVLLAPPAVRSGLPADEWPRDAVGFLRRFPPSAAAGSPGPSRDDGRRLVAMRFLLWRAAGLVARLGASPPAEALDAIETDLRGAAALRRALAETCVPAALGRVQAWLGRSMESLPGAVLRTWIHQAVAVAAATIDGADGTEAAEGRVRLPRLVGLEMDRALAKSGDAATQSGRKAAARHGPGEIALDAPPERWLTPWCEDVPDFRRLRGVEGGLPAAERTLLAARFGWDGHLPSTVASLAAERGGTAARMQRHLSGLLARIRERSSS
ncbi:MAG: helix-turn-helix domain-containing protein [Phycisphaerales bacterium]